MADSIGLGSHHNDKVKRKASEVDNVMKKSKPTSEMIQYQSIKLLEYSNCETYMLEFETELSNLMSILEDDHKEYLEVNDDVIHKGAWGSEPPRVARVTGIQRMEDDGTNK